MSGIKDLVKLKMEKKLLEAQIRDVNKASKKLNKVLERKKLDKRSSLFTEAPRPEERTMAAGVPLNDLRIGTKSVKAIAKPPPTRLEDIPPCPIPFGSNLERIRHQHIQRTTGKREIVRRNKIKAEKEERRKQRREQKRKDLNIAPSMFPNRYKRGELPCTIEHGARGLYLSWVCPLDNLDYDYYLPIFFDGLQCTDHTLVFLSCQGIEDMLYASQGYPERIIPSLPKLARPIRNALSKYHVPTLLNVLKALRQLVQCNEGVGVALTPFYSMFLAPMNMFIDKNRDTGDEMDYGQRNNDDVGEEIRNTLETMERLGAENAFRCIKFAIPPYQSYKEGL